MLTDSAGQVASLIRQEETLFLRTMSRGLELLNTELDEMQEQTAVLSGQSIFRLYDTYGFPFDLTTTIAAERGYAVDIAGAEDLMTLQRARARASSNFGLDAAADTDPAKLPAEIATAWQVEGVQSHFTGYHTMMEENARVIAVSVDEDGDGAWVALERCPFYPTGGGQLGECIHTNH